MVRVTLINAWYTRHSLLLIGFITITEHVFLRKERHAPSLIYILFLFLGQKQFSLKSFKFENSVI